MPFYHCKAVAWQTLSYEAQVYIWLEVKRCSAHYNRLLQNLAVATASNSRALAFKALNYAKYIRQSVKWIISKVQMIATLSPMIE
jgi:hypothetical protein